MSVVSLSDLTSRAHLRRPDGSFTIVGFGSLVARGSASLNFAFTNYRPARVHGWQRVFNLAHAGNMRHEGTWHYTGEVASLAFMRSPYVVSDVVLLDVDVEGLGGFLKRESLYSIVEVNYVEPSGDTGIALACGEYSDAHMLDSDLQAHGFGGRMWYLNSEECMRMPAVAGIVVDDAPLFEQLQLAQKHSVEFYYSGPQAPAVVRPRSHVYPAPRYLKLCYLAHRKAGILQNFMETTLLMDRQTTIAEYLFMNENLMNYMNDPRGVKEYLLQ